MRLYKALILIFLSLIIILIIITSIISTTMINKQFETYLIGEREDKFTNIYRVVNEDYIDDNLEIDGMELKHYALSENVDIIIEDIDGEILYNSRTYTDEHFTNGNDIENKNNINLLDGEYMERVYDLFYNNYSIGTLIIGYINDAYLTEGAMLFKHTLTPSFIISGIATIIIGILFSIFLSKRLTTPLISIRNTANEIQSGNLDAKSNIETNITEILELSNSINYLGRTLAKEEDIRKKYASDISHELRTPLTTLKAHIEAIIDGVWEADKDNLNILMSEINRLNTLVDDLKDSFNAEEYNIILNKTNFNISKELDNIITSFTPMYNSKGYSIGRSIEDNIEVFMDKDKFKQIINNLLSNSFNYLRKDGNVSIYLWKSKNNLNLNIKDNGTGIREEDLPYIFNRFYRVDESRNKSTGGTGLGLSIVKSIIEAHKGKISIDSIYGKGTSINISLPQD